METGNLDKDLLPGQIHIRELQAITPSSIALVEQAETHLNQWSANITIAAGIVASKPAASRRSHEIVENAHRRHAYECERVAKWKSAIEHGEAQ